VIIPSDTQGREVHMMNGVSIKLVQRIREEFEEAPWLRFTVDEAAQFWGLDPDVCGEVLARLTAAEFLVSGIDGRLEMRDAVVLAGAAGNEAVPLPEVRRAPAMVACRSSNAPQTVSGRWTGFLPSNTQRTCFSSTRAGMYSPATVNVRPSKDARLRAAL
jgi:hypothetical protein